MFSRNNFMIMLSGIALILIGFFVMTLDKEPYGFGALGLTVGPGLTMLGFIVEIYAILHKDKS